MYKVARKSSNLEIQNQLIGWVTDDKISVFCRAYGRVNYKEQRCVFTLKNSAVLIQGHFIDKISYTTSFERDRAAQLLAIQHGSNPELLFGDSDGNWWPSSRLTIMQKGALLRKLVAVAIGWREKQAAMEARQGAGYKQWNGDDLFLHMFNNEPEF